MCIVFTVFVQTEFTSQSYIPCVFRYQPPGGRKLKVNLSVLTLSSRPPLRMRHFNRSRAAHISSSLSELIESKIKTCCSATCSDSVMKNLHFKDFFWVSDLFRVYFPSEACCRIIFTNKVQVSLYFRVLLEK